MKVEKNVTIFAGEPEQARRQEQPGKAQDGEKEKKSGIIYAGNFQGDMSIRDRIQQKKEQAQRKAMKAVRDAWDGDRSIDDDLNRRREHITELNQSSKEAQERIEELKGQQEKIREAYGVSEDGGEPQGLADYQREQMSLEEHIKAQQNVLDENERQVYMENAVIRGTKLERLKYHHMADAQKEAEGIMQAANKEILGMLTEDAKEHIDEEQEEREEKAEKIKEKKEEQEELAEKRREERKELEELAEDAPVDEMLDLAKTQAEIRQEVQNIVDKMSLVAEDIKGAVVDANV